MPIHGGTMTIGTSAIQVDGNFNGWSHIHIRNDDSTKTLYIGGSDVTVANGLPIDKMTTIEFDIPPGDSFFLITDSGICSVSWLRIDH
jgi:hypothetical protein